ncbi:MAG: hypothetical protein IPH57_18495 [Saprospiraceae bacterium]|nr:hypothetical protein [Saprospiraceae bacterium]
MVFGHCFTNRFFVGENTNKGKANNSLGNIKTIDSFAGAGGLVFDLTLL